MAEKIRSYRELKIWQLGMEIVEIVYKVSRDFPKEERYCLTSQRRRASISLPSNIAEGFARRSNKEYSNFLNIMLGSNAELETQIEIALRLNYISFEMSHGLFEKTNYLNRMTINLMKKLNT